MQLPSLVIFYPWFVAGYLFKPFYANVSKFFSKKPNHFATIGLIVIIVLYISKNVWIDVKSTSLLAALLISFSFWVIAIWVKTIIIEEKVLTHFGKYSLQYYLYHCLDLLPCYYVGSLFYGYGQWLSLLVIYLMAIFVSYLILLISKKNTFLKKLSGL